MSSAVSSPDAFDSPLLWQLPRPGVLRRAAWGDEAVIFHAQTGRTHLIDAFGNAVLESIGAEAATLRTIAFHLQTRFAWAPETIRRRLPATLADFARNGLLMASAP